MAWASQPLDGEFPPIRSERSCVIGFDSSHVKDFSIQRNYVLVPQQAVPPLFQRLHMYRALQPKLYVFYRLLHPHCSPRLASTFVSGSSGDVPTLAQFSSRLRPLV